MTESFIGEIPFEDRMRIAEEVVTNALSLIHDSEVEIAVQAPAFFDERGIQGMEVILDKLNGLHRNRVVLNAIGEVLSILSGDTKYNGGGIYLTNGQKLDFNRPLADFYYENIVGGVDKIESEMELG